MTITVPENEINLLSEETKKQLDTLKQIAKEKRKNYDKVSNGLKQIICDLKVFASKMDHTYFFDKDEKCFLKWCCVTKTIHYMDGTTDGSIPLLATPIAIRINVYNNYINKFLDAVIQEEGKI